MPAVSTKAILAGAVAAAMVGAEARAQQPPADLPPLPDDAGPIVPRPAMDAPPAVAPQPAAGPCIPGHCHHRTPLGRWRCKRHLQEVMLGFPEEFERPPLGALMHAANGAQVANGEAASMVLHHFDFENGAAQPNLRGRDRLGVIATRLPQNFHPVVIERSGQPALDDSRRQAVIAALNAGPFPVPAERVVIAPPRSRGLPGAESVLIYEGLLQRTAEGGPPVGVGVAPSNRPSER